MTKSELTKERIIIETTKLIQEQDGDIDQITIRELAKRANIGVGLINHYFTSKELLIEVCVQRIISNVIYSFSPAKANSNTPEDALSCITIEVMDFLMKNQQISKISILSDMKAPKPMDNTMKTVLGFTNSINSSTNTLKENNNSEHIKKAFMLTAILQEAFLRKDVLEESIGVNFYDKAQRDTYIKSIVATLM